MSVIILDTHPVSGAQPSCRHAPFAITVANCCCNRVTWFSFSFFCLNMFMYMQAHAHKLRRKRPSSDLVGALSWFSFSPLPPAPVCRHSVFHSSVPAELVQPPGSGVPIHACIIHQPKCSAIAGGTLFAAATTVRPCSRTLTRVSPFFGHAACSWGVRCLQALHLD